MSVPCLVVKRWLGIGIPVAVGLVALIEVAYRSDPEHPSFAECLLAVLLLVSLIAIVRSGLDRGIPMSKTARIIRIVGGGLWALMLLLGMVLKVWSALR